MEREKCPNPNGEIGICYAFDRHGDRCGCVGCPLLDTLPGGLFNEGDPLEGLTKILEEKYQKDSAPNENVSYNGGRKKVDSMEEHICCICGEKFKGFGNNPYPLTDDENARCCDECNTKYVITARIFGIKPDEKDKIKALVTGNYEIVEAEPENEENENM